MALAGVIQIQLKLVRVRSRHGESQVSLLKVELSKPEAAQAVQIQGSINDIYFKLF
jgi:hypothetical protein